MKIIISKDSIKKLQILVLVLLFFIYPLSINGIASATYEIIAVTILSISIIILAIAGGINPHKVLLSVIVLAYLGIATLLTLSGANSGFKFGILRFLYYFSTLLAFSTNVNGKSIDKFLIKILDVIICLEILLNIMSFLNLFGINTFLVARYTQYLDYITTYHLSLGKPILFYGVHNIAAFIYEGLFIVSYQTYCKYRAKRHIVYSIVMLVFLVMLRCSTSVIFSIVSIGILVYSETQSRKKLIYSLLIMLTIVILSVHFGLIDVYSEILGMQNNGIIARYSDGGIGVLFRDNIEAIKTHFLGTGYCISDGSTKLYGADSGLLINFMVGKIPFFIMFYWLFWKYLSSNMKRKNVLIVFAFILIMELGFITFLYFRTISLIVFMVYYLNALEESSNV